MESKGTHFFLLVQVKTAQQSHYFECVSLLISNHPRYPALALRAFMEKEIGTTILNYRLLSLVLKAMPEGERQMAFVFQDLAKVEENKAKLQSFLRRIHRAPKDTIQFDVVRFATALLEECPSVADCMGGVRDAWVAQIADLTCLSMFLCVPSSAHEIKDPVRLQDLQMRVSTIQRLATIWCHSIAGKYLSSNQLVSHFLRKVLILEPMSSYSFLNTSDNSGDANAFALVHEDVPIHDVTASYVLQIMGDGGREPGIGLDILSRLYYRAAALQLRDNTNYETLLVSMDYAQEIVQGILRLASFPPGAKEQSPWMIVEDNLFSKACALLLIMASFNPRTVGDLVWQTYPTVKQLMEMSIMQRFIFCPAENQPVRDQKVENFKVTRQQALTELQQAEDATSQRIQEQLNSNKIIFAPPTQPFDWPRADLENFQRFSRNFGLSKVLCASRAPDFLVDIMQRQGARLAVSWLLPIVRDDPAALSNLPVSALVHLLVAYIDREIISQTVDDFVLLLRQFRKYFDDNQDPVPTQEIINLLISELSSPSLSLRHKVKKACSIVFSRVGASSPHKTDDLGNSTDRSKTTPRGPSMFSPGLTSPSQAGWHQSPSTDLRSSSGSIAGEPELKAKLTESASFRWLSSLKDLRHYAACCDQIFHSLRGALEKEVLEEDFKDLLAFLEELSESDPLRRRQLAVTLGDILSGRRVVVEQLFRSPFIYKAAVSHLWSVLQQAREDTQSPPEEIKKAVTQLREKEARTKRIKIEGREIAIRLSDSENLFRVFELIIVGLIHAISFSSKSLRLLVTLSRTESEFYQTHDTIIHALFGQGDRSPTRYKEGTENEFLPLVSEENARDLICASQDTLYQVGARLLPSSALFGLMRSFGISPGGMTLLLTRLLAEFSGDDLRRIMHQLQPIDQENTRQRLTMYAAMEVDLAGKLLHILNAGVADMEDEVMDEKEPLLVLPEEEDASMMGTDDLFAPLRGIQAKDVKTLLNQYLHVDTEHAVRDQLINGLLWISCPYRTRVSSDDISQVTMIIQVLVTQLESYGEDPENLNRLLRIIHRIPSSFMNLVDALESSVDNLKLLELASRLAAVYQKIYTALDGISLPSCRPSTSLLVRYLQRLRDKRPMEPEANASSSVDAMEQDHEPLTLAQLEENILAMSHPDRKWELEGFLSSVVYGQPCELMTVLLGVVRRLEDYHECMGILLDYVGACAGVAEEKNHLELYETVFSVREGVRRPYTLLLLSMILHGQSWQSMRRCNQWIFSQSLASAEATSFHYHNALEFFRAMSLHPRSWSAYTAGERKSAPLGRSHSSLATVCKYTPQQIVALVGLIRGEQRAGETDQLNKRIQFLLSVMRTNRTSIYPVLLCTNQSVYGMSEVETECLDRIRTMVYLTFPQEVRSGTLLPDPSLGGMKRESKLDLTLHRLLRALLDHNHCDAAFKVLSSLAIQHRSILLRYLPIMTALLQGRTHLAAASFVEKSFVRLFIQCLSVLDLLRPQVFLSDDLDAFLGCYFGLLENWSRESHEGVLPVMERFVNFLWHMSHCFSYKLRAHLKILRRLRKTHPDLPKLSLLIRQIEKGEEDTMESNASLQVSGEEQKRLRHALLEWQTFEEQESVSLLDMDRYTSEVTSESIVQKSLHALDELNGLSLQNPSGLGHFLKELGLLIRSPSAQPEQRRRAYALLIHYLHFNPRSSSQVIPDFLRCFSSHSFAVQADALRYAQEFYFFAQGMYFIPSSLFLFFRVVISCN